MNEITQNHFKNLVQSHPRLFEEEPSHFKHLLREQLKDQRPAYFSLLNAFEEGIPVALQVRQYTTPPPLLRAQLIQLLQDSRAMNQVAAAWAVESWARALGIALQTAPSEPLNSGFDLPVEDPFFEEEAKTASPASTPVSDPLGALCPQCRQPLTLIRGAVRQSCSFCGWVSHVALRTDRREVKILVTATLEEHIFDRPYVRFAVSTMVALAFAGVLVSQFNRRSPDRPRGPGSVVELLEPGASGKQLADDLTAGSTKNVLKYFSQPGAQYDPYRYQVPQNYNTYQPPYQPTVPQYNFSQPSSNYMPPSFNSQSGNAIMQPRH